MNLVSYLFECLVNLKSIFFLCQKLEEFLMNQFLWRFCSTIQKDIEIEWRYSAKYTMYQIITENRVATKPGNQGIQGNVREFHCSGKIREMSGNFEKILFYQGIFKLHCFPFPSNFFKNR